MTACPELQTDLSLDDAHAVLEPYFLAIQEEFVGSGLDRVGKTRLYVAPWVHDSPRHFAACREDGRIIVAAPELCEQDERIVAAIFAHELGHAADFCYPAEFVFVGQGQPARRRAREEGSDVQWVRWVKAWERRDADLVEFTADAVAQSALGLPIGYTGPCMLQSFDGAQARPQGLR